MTEDVEKRKANWRRWYERNKHDPKYKKKIRDFDIRRKQELVDWLEEIKSQMKCCECGFSHPAALDFHHRNPNEKLYNVSEMTFKGIGKSKILDEIAKCNVLCSNCHRIEHWKHRQTAPGCAGVAYLVVN